MHSVGAGAADDVARYVLAGLILTSVRGLRQDMQAQIGGQLEGLREAITVRSSAS